MVLKELLYSLCQVCFIVKLDVLAMSYANENFQKLIPQESMLIIIVIFKFVVVRSDKISVNDAYINISVYNSSTLHEFRKGDLVKIRVSTFDSGHCKDFFEGFEMNSDDFLYSFYYLMLEHSI